MAVFTKESIRKAIEKALEDKGKRKFKQSVEFIINFRGIDFKKPENRLNLSIVLPHEPPKKRKIAVFAEGQTAFDAKKAGFTVFEPQDIEELSKDKKRLKSLAKEYEFIAEPKLMVQVGKSLGQVLGPRGKLPRPIVGSLEATAKQVNSSVRIMTKGKYLPVVQCAIGTEDMSPNDLADNAEAVYEKIRAKVGDQYIKSLYVKLTMGKAVKVE
ncbi:50S ribosomal protein L1 [Candidatus Micrarchaeota archaeon]|nr:50S ribosomal protein L1 [Candidatus Micrarchaeota archaeon]